MSTSRFFLGVAASLLFLGCPEQKSLSEQVSIVHLLAYPEKYNGYRVMVNGYLVGVGGRLYLYLSKEDALMWNIPAAIVVEDTTPNKAIANNDQCLNIYVSIIGTFSRIKRLDEWGINSIQKVTRYKFTEEEKSAERIGCWPHDPEKETEKQGKSDSPASPVESEPG